MDDLFFFTQSVIRLYRIPQGLASNFEHRKALFLPMLLSGKKLCYSSRMQKLYCYIDEAGQHTKGRLFVVSVVVIDTTDERDRIALLLENIEQVSRKRRQKWRNSKHEERFAYMKAVLTNSAFEGLLFYQMHFNSQAYVDMTVQTTASAIRSVAKADYKATVLVDGLADSMRESFGIALRQRNVKTKKVHGVDDRKEVFIRLADALCGFVVDAYTGNEFYSELLKQGKRNNYINLVE
ncbi:MAG: DUF3800 domain-containing protein [Chloroflexota bacterium]